MTVSKVRGLQPQPPDVRQHALEGLVTELVWDAGRTGTATAASGATLSSGDGADWTPEELLAAAAAACLMRTFLAVAGRAGLDVLGYVTAADASVVDGRIHLRVCVVVEDEGAAREASALCAEAVAQSGVASLVGERLLVDVTVRCLSAAGAPGE